MMSKAAPDISGSFNGFFDPNIVFSTERGIRDNPALFSQYCRGFLEEDNLPISMIAFDFHEKINEGRTRKDKKTPAKQHEQTITRTLIAALDVCDVYIPYNTAYKNGLYFSKDIIVTAALLHDVLENHKDKYKNVTKLFDAFESFINAIPDLNKKEKASLVLDMASAMRTVRILTRDENARNTYNKGLLEDPAAVIIKLIDWTNKLATMVGVEAFEDNNQAGMKRALEETELLFVDEFQGFISEAKERYPELNEILNLLDDYMACVYHPLKAYSYYATEPKSGNPSNSIPYKFSKISERPTRLLKLLPPGLNWPKTSLNRMIENPCEYERIPDYCHSLAIPALKKLIELTPNPSSRNLPALPNHALMPI